MMSKQSDQVQEQTVIQSALQELQMHLSKQLHLTPGEIGRRLRNEATRLWQSQEVTDVYGNPVEGEQNREPEFER